ncbi:MAG TPA: mechanosensitive ion channel family protein [Candidatus Binataceae bacterium]|nr:mechanosensitive ion channel family protein [Candidatus Binataceae bacterium]
MTPPSLKTLLGLATLPGYLSLAIETGAMVMAALAGFALRRRERLIGPAPFVMIALGFGADLIMRLMPAHSELAVSFEAVGLVLFFFGVIRLGLDLLRLLMPHGANASNIFRDLLMLLLYTVTVMLVLRATTKVDLTSLLATSAVLSVIVGLGLQETLGNIFSGLSMQLQKPFEPGDWVRYGDHLGQVVGIGWRATRLLTHTKERLEIPNVLLSKEVLINYAAAAVAEDLLIGLPTSQPPHQVKEILMAVLSSTPGVLDKPEPQVLVVGYAESAISYRMRFWMADYGIHEEARDSILSNLWYALKRNGIEIPYPTRTLLRAPAQPDSQRPQAQEQRLMGELRQVDFLRGLGDEDLGALLPNCRIHQFGPGEVLMHEGGAGDCLHILRRGQVEISARAPGGGRLHLGNLTPPAFFGEIALMTGEPRTASVIARSEVEVVELNRQAFADLFRRRPAALEEISAVMDQRLSETRERLRNAGETGERRGERGWLVSKMRELFDL